MQRPLNLTPLRQPCLFGNIKRNAPEIVLAPIASDDNRRYVTLVVLFGKTPPTAKCPAIPRQPQVTLINLRQASLFSITRLTRWYLFNPYRQRSPSKFGLTPTMQRSTNACNMHPTPQPRNPWSSTYVSKAFATPPPSKLYMLRTREWRLSLYLTVHPMQSSQTWHRVTHQACPIRKGVWSHLWRQIQTRKPYRTWMR